MNSKLENLDDMVAMSKIVALYLIVLFAQAVEILLIEELAMFDHISVRLNMIMKLFLKTILDNKITYLSLTYNLFSILSYSTKHSLTLVIDHFNRQMYPLGYLFIVLRNIKSQRILTCFNLHNRFPYLHDQHLTDYEGTKKSKNTIELIQFHDSKLL